MSAGEVMVFLLVNTLPKRFGGGPELFQVIDVAGKAVIREDKAVMH